MAELLLNKCMEKGQTESNLSITNTNNDMNIELNKEFSTELQSNAYHGKFDEDVVDHVAKMSGIVNSPPGEYLLEDSSVNSSPYHRDMSFLDLWMGNNESSDYIVSSDNESEEYEYGNPPDTTSDSFLNPYMKTQEKNNIKREDEQGQTKRKYKDTSNSSDKQPNKRVCKEKSLKL
nr:hypothetical protein [Tanacetum cinerariifolium]